MPMLSPKENEMKKDYIARFLADETMKKEYPDEKQRLAVANQNWDGKKEMAEIETVNMRKEILSVGVWNGINITEEIIEEMIRNFNELRDRKPVPLRVGHASDDKPSSRVLAAGWVDGLEKIDNKLIAKIRNTPLKIAEFIRKEFLKPVSIEFLKFWKDGETGKKFKNVLNAIAVMGAAAPAVAGLQDFEIFFTADEAGLKKIEYQEENVMTKELQEKIAKLEAEKAVLLEGKEKAVEFQENLEVKEQELEKNKAELVAEKQKMVEFVKKQELHKIEEFVEKNSSETSMKILPAEKDRVSRILAALDNEMISFSEKDTKMNAREEFEAFIGGLENRIEFKKKTKTGKNEKNVNFSDEDERENFIFEKVEEKITEFKEKGKEINFKDATLHVFKENKEVLEV